MESVNQAYRGFTTGVMPGFFVRLLIGGVGAALCAQPVWASEYVLGQADQLALDQPRVAFGLYDSLSEVLIGPEFYNSALLDTGANGILMAGLSYVFDEDYTQAEYLGDLAYYSELGVAGSSLLEVYEPHLFAVAGASGEALVTENLIAFGDPNLDLGSFAAIVGMPAMAGRVVEVDLRPNLQLDFQEVNFYESLSHVGFDSAGSFDVALRMVAPEHTDTSLPEAMRPTFAALPVIDGVDMRTTGGALGNGTFDSVNHTFLVDTGAQTMIISEAMAAELKLDIINTFNNGGDVVDYLEVGGIGGTVDMPLVVIDRISIPTTTGVDLVFTNLLVGVLDIDGAPFDAVLGMNMFTTGYLNAAFGGGLGGGLTNGTSQEEFDVYVDQGLFFLDIQDVIDQEFITITYDDLVDLADLGLITDDFDDYSQVYADLMALEGEFGGNGAQSTAFDKIVFDFTPTDGTALLRLDLTSLHQIGDATGDGIVDEADIQLINSNWGTFGDQADGDVNGDGLVNNEDLVLALRHFGENVAGGGDVPEPGTGVVVGLCLLGLTHRRSDRR